MTAPRNVPEHWSHGCLVCDAEPGQPCTIRWEPGRLAYRVHQSRKVVTPR